MKKFKKEGRKMNNRQLIYGTDYKNEKDVVAQCLIYARHIENVLEIKGMEFIDTYLSERYEKLCKKENKNNDK